MAAKATDQGLEFLGSFLQFTLSINPIVKFRYGRLALETKFLDNFFDTAKFGVQNFCYELNAGSSNCGSLILSRIKRQIELFKNVISVVPIIDLLWSHELIDHGRALHCDRPGNSTVPFLQRRYPLHEIL